MSTAIVLKNFRFQPHELPLKLQKCSEELQTGHWEVRLQPHNKLFYLAIVQGQVVFAGEQRLSWLALQQALQRYIPALRTVAAKEAIALLEVKTCAEHKLLGQRLRQLELALELPYNVMIEALQLQILTVAGQLATRAGEANFTLDVGLGKHSPMVGLSFEKLSYQLEIRQQNWRELRNTIPTLNAIPILNKLALEKANLSRAQKQQIAKLTSFGKSLELIAHITAKDTLTTAKIFANLVQSGLVSLQFPGDFTLENSAQPNILIVDDSAIFLQQFQILVNSWGYRVTTCSTTDTAIETIVTVRPDLIFLDINMPGMSGFELLKALRREAQLTQQTLVLLTAENSLANQWRAKWGSCEFLAKPRAQVDIPSFQLELKQLLQGIVTSK